MAEPSQEYGTIIGADATFKGEMNFDSAAKVLGKFEGSIAAKGKVHIASGSRCKATVSANEVAVEGHIEGNVEATDRIEIKSKGRITGDIVAARMVMGDGASLDGHCRIGSTNGQSRAVATTEIKPEEVKAAASARAK